jgi:hypothetical protein
MPESYGVNDEPWTPITFTYWPDSEDGAWNRTEAALSQRFGEQRIAVAQDAEDVAMEEGL